MPPRKIREGEEFHPLSLNVPQGQFLNIQKPFRAFVGGYRSGKTFVGCTRDWMLASKYPGIKLGYFAPTYPQVRDIFYPTMEETALEFGDLLGVPCWTEVKKAEHLVEMYINGSKYATVMCRSMDEPKSIVGFDISHAMVDEVDTMKKEKAQEAWVKIIARLSSKRRDYKVPSADFTSTPEGFNWIHDFFVKQVTAKPELAKLYGHVVASTRQNEINLPDSYIPSLYATYPAQLVDAYIDGKFVNLTSGSIYADFDRVKNHSNEVDDGKECLFIGMDFNVNNMSAIIHVKRGDKVIAVDEILEVRDTPAMITILEDRYKDRKLNIYPDSSGDNNKSNCAGLTDISQLRSAGFTVRCKKSNPRVRDRINCVNAMIFNGKGARKYFVNTRMCPVTTDCLEQQVFDKNGEPDKKSGNDHPNDALGYFITFDYPIKKPFQHIPTSGL